MRSALSAACLLTSLLAAPLFASDADSVPPNPAIDMDAHLRLSQEAACARETHRVTEEEFLQMSREPGTVILDARSASRYAELHVQGAVNLSFPDFTAERLAAVIPDQSTRVLIYCNNNFVNAASAFPTKLPAASLNLSTYVTLFIYGYRNVWELAPLLDAKACRLELESAAK
jgi:phage shock protein E